MSGLSSSQIRSAYLPWVVLCIIVFLWGIPDFKTVLNKLGFWTLPVPVLHEAIVCTPPVVTVAKVEKAIFVFNPISATGSGVFLASLIVGTLLGFTPLQLARTYLGTIYRIRHSVLSSGGYSPQGFHNKS